jgi:hypothetical protein
MKSTDFYSELKSLPTTFNWSISDSNTIIGDGRRHLKGVTFNPITAIAYRITGNLYESNKRDTHRAGKAIGLSNEFVEHVYDATKSSYNRGNAQVVRGKIRSALGV